MILNRSHLINFKTFKECILRASQTYWAICSTANWHNELICSYYSEVEYRRYRILNSDKNTTKEYQRRNSRFKGGPRFSKCRVVTTLSIIFSVVVAYEPYLTISTLHFARVYPYCHYNLVCKRLNENSP
jgi:hypothetical protein